MVGVEVTASFLDSDCDNDPRSRPLSRVAYRPI